jgi:hypothetical protein
MTRASAGGTEVVHAGPEFKRVSHSSPGCCCRNGLCNDQPCRVSGAAGLSWMRLQGWAGLSCPGRSLCWLPGARQNLRKPADPLRIRERTGDGRKPRVCAGAAPTIERRAGVDDPAASIRGVLARRVNRFSLANRGRLMLETARTGGNAGSLQGCSSAGRVPVSKTGCRRFEPCRPCQYFQSLSHHSARTHWERGPNLDPIATAAVPGTGSWRV